MCSKILPFLSMKKTPLSSFSPGGCSPLNIVASIWDLGIRLLELYERIRDYGRASYIAYPILVNMNRFILNVAWFLFTVIAEWFYDKFKIRMWNYDPTQQKSWRRENPDDDAF